MKRLKLILFVPANCEGDTLNYRQLLPDYETLHKYPPARQVTCFIFVYAKQLVIAVLCLTANIFYKTSFGNG